MANELKHGSVGTELTQAEWEAVGTHVIDSQAKGDIIYASSPSQLSRLGIGSDDDRLEVATDVPAWVSPDKSARVYHSVAQTTSNATRLALAFDSERFDTDSIHDTSTNNSRLTCQTAGVYVITGTISYAANATGIRNIEIRLNGSTFIALSHIDAVSSGNMNMTTATIYQLAVDDYVELTVRQTSGGALDVEAAGNRSAEFSMAKILG